MLISLQLVPGYWPLSRKSVLWLNKADMDRKEMALVRLMVCIALTERTLLISSQYGNEATMTWHYSRAALIIKVPSFKARELHIAPSSVDKAEL